MKRWSHDWDVLRELHGNASWHSSLSPTHLLKWTPNPNNKEERFDTYGTYHPCQSWWLKEHHPNNLICLWWLNSSDSPFRRKWNIEMIVFWNDATMQLMDWSSMYNFGLVIELKMGFRLKSDGILLFTFHKSLKIISW